MAGDLTLFEGPPGSGKSQLVKKAIEDGEIEVVSDVTSIWVALRQVEREPETGRYPIRKDSDPALTKGLLSAIQTQVVRLSLSRGLRVAVTSGSRGTSEKWKGDC